MHVFEEKSLGLAQVLQMAEHMVADKMTPDSDGSKLTAAEELHLLRTLVNSMPDFIFVKDRESRFVFSNKAHMEELCIPSIAQLLGKTDLDIFPKELAEHYFSDEQAIIASGEPIIGHEEPFVDTAGRAGWLSTTKEPWYDSQGRIAGIVGISRNITARKRAEEVMFQSKELAEEANQAKSQFLASMSHELRTPLNSVIGFAGILLKNKDGKLGKAELGFLERIRSNGKHLLKLINEVLDLSKIEARKVDLQLGRVSLDDLVRDTIAEQEGLIRDRPLELLADVPASLAPIETDADKLKQVIINLVGNALKFTEQGTVTVRVETTLDSDRPARVDVIDTGMGMRTETLERIFDAFQQADASIAGKFGGTGLGLTISEALCRLMGYRISVQSEFGKGTTFSVHLVPEPAGGCGDRGH